MTNTSDITTKQKDSLQSSPTIKKSHKNKEHLDQVLLTQKELDQIKTNLNKMIDAMAFNPSLFSRAARYWGELPLWQKIIAGGILIVPLFTIAILVQVAVLFAISIFTLITYTAGSILLDNHHRNNINSTENLKTGIAGLADALGKVILSLDALREQLGVQIEQFQQENQQLSENVSNLNDEIQSLNEQSELLKSTEKALRATQIDLEQTAGTLKISLEEQTQLQTRTQAELDQVKLGFEKNQKDLAEKISEFGAVKTQMSSEIEKGRLVVETLKGALESLSKTLLQDKKQQQAFKEKLDVFLSNEEASFHLIAERIGKAERQLVLVTAELTQTKDQLDANVKRYEQLLNREEQHIIRFEKIEPSPTQKPKASKGQALTEVGIFAVDERANRAPDQVVARTLIAM